VTSRTTAMPEVGGPFAIYVDPTEPRALEEALERLLGDDTARAAAEARIRREFRPRTWSDVAERLVRDVAALRQAG